MFLFALNDREAEAFLELAHIAMHVDGVIAKEEQDLLENFRIELDLVDYSIQEKTQEELVAIFELSTKQVKRVVLLELSCMLYSDKSLTEDERLWIEKLSKDFALSMDDMSRLLSWSRDYVDFIDVALMYIHSK